MTKRISIVLLLAFAALLATGCASHDDDPYVAGSYSAGQVQEIRMEVRDRRIEVLPSEDDQVHMDYFHNETEGYAIDLTGGVLTVNGGRGYDALALDPGEYRLPGNVSSQFFSGLLFALPLLGGDSLLVPTTPLESRDYLEMTRQALETAGVRSDWQGDALHVPGRQAYRPFEAAVEADWSQAGFWYAANFLDSRVEIRGLDPASPQGDKVVSELYWKLARPGTEAEIDVSGCPDLLPPLAVMAAVRSGTTRFVNAGRLRIKESDRLSTVRALLTGLGGRAEEGPDFLTVHGGPLSGGAVDCAGDHRIAMAAAIAATDCAGPVTVRGAECVKKSYPDFWEVYKNLGGEFRVL